MFELVMLGRKYAKAHIKQLIYSLFNNAVSSSDYSVSNGRMISEKQIGKDVAGSSLGLI
jgi:hypothetical protein